MNENKLIDNIANIYIESLEAQKTEKLKNNLFYFLRDRKTSVNSGMVKNKHEELGLPEHITNNLLEALELEYKAAKEIENNLNKRSKNEIIQESTDNYFKTVSSFTSNGGKNFYDIGSVIHIENSSSKDIIKEKIKELQNNGIDIKIIKETEKEIREEMHSIIALVLPSSQYKEFEKMIINELSKNENDYIRFSRSNYFIPPFIRNRDILPNLEEQISTREEFENINYNIFCIYGYSTNSIDTSGGYGKFNNGERAVVNLRNTVIESLSLAHLYENNNEHVNGMMPTLMCFSKDDVKNIDINSENKKVRKTIVKDVILYELEQKIEQDLSLNKTKKKRLKRN